VRHARFLRDVEKSLREFDRTRGVFPSPYPTPKQRATCIFCGGSPVNREHMWPQWAHGYIPKGKRKWRALHLREGIDRTDFIITNHGGDPHDFQVRCVDERCNNGWMRDLENRVKPILRPLITGKETRLVEADQEAVAAWIALKAMVQEYAPHSAVISHHKQRKRLFEKQQISRKSWRVWIGRYAGNRPDELWITTPALLLPDRIVRRKKSRAATYYNSQAATYVLGELLIHLLRSPDTLGVRLFQFHPAVRWKLRPIWPPTGLSIVWPTAGLSAAEGLFVARAFRNEVQRTAKAVMT